MPHIVRIRSAVSQWVNAIAMKVVYTLIVVDYESYSAKVPVTVCAEQPAIQGDGSLPKLGLTCAIVGDTGRAPVNFHALTRLSEALRFTIMRGRQPTHEYVVERYFVRPRELHADGKCPSRWPRVWSGGMHCHDRWLEQNYELQGLLPRSLPGTDRRIIRSLATIFVWLIEVQWLFKQGKGSVNA